MFTGPGKDLVPHRRKTIDRTWELTRKELDFFYQNVIFYANAISISVIFLYETVDTRPGALAPGPQ